MLRLTIEWDLDNRRHFAKNGRCEQRDPRENARFRYEGQTCNRRYVVVIRRAERFDHDKPGNVLAARRASSSEVSFMEKHHEIAMKKPVWPRGAPIPSFKSYAEELKFWHAYDFESDQSKDGWEEVPRTTKRAELTESAKAMSSSPCPA